MAGALVVAACGGSSSDSTSQTRTRNAALISNDTPTMIIKDIASKGTIDLFLTDDNIVRVIGANHNNLDSFREAIAGKTISTIRVSLANAAVLDSDGTLYVGGYRPDLLNVTLPAGATRWVDVSLGANDIVAIADNGEVRTASRDELFSMPTLSNEGTRFVQVASGWFHHVFLDDKGNVYTTGDNSYGQRNLPALTNGGTHFVKVAANFDSTGLIDDKGNAYLFGWELSNATVPTLAKGGTKFVDIAIGTKHAVLLDDVGNLYHTGTAFDMPFRIPTGTKIVKIAAAAQRSLALDDSGIVHEARAAFTVGGGYFSQRVPVLPVVASGNSTLVIDQNGKIVQLGVGLAAPVPDANDIVSIGAGLNHGLGLNNKGEVRAWGEDGWGQVSQAAGMSNLVKVVGGPAWSAGLTRFGEIVGWGTGAPIPTFFDGSVRDIVAGHNHLTLLLTYGEIESWGSLGDLAPNFDNWRRRNLDDMTFRRYRAIATHGECAAAIGLPIGKSGEGKPHYTSWGECSDSVASAPDLSKATALAIGLDHGAAIMTNGSVIAWGDNSLGQTTIPEGLTKAIFISAGDNHTVAVDTEGRVWAWGDNSVGQTDIPTSLRLSAAELAAATAAAEEGKKAAAAPTEVTVDIAESLAAATAALPAQSSTDAQVLAAQLVSQLPADVPEGVIDAVLQSIPIDLNLNTTIARPSSPTVKASKKVTAARALSLLKIKGATKPSFVVSKRPKSSPCTVSKSTITAKKRGMCSAVVSYTDVKGKKALATFAVLVTS